MALVRPVMVYEVSVPLVVVTVVHVVAVDNAYCKLYFSAQGTVRHLTVTLVAAAVPVVGEAGVAQVV